MAFPEGTKYISSPSLSLTLDCWDQSLKRVCDLLGIKKTLQIPPVQQDSSEQTDACSLEPPNQPQAFSPKAALTLRAVLPRVCTSWLLPCAPSLSGSGQGVFLPTVPTVQQECGLQLRVQRLFQRGFVFRSSALGPGARLPSLLHLRPLTHV